jgi:hypothetical protein
VYYGIRTWFALKYAVGWCCPRKKQAIFVATPPTSTLEFHEHFTIETLEYIDGVKKHIVHPLGSSNESSSSSSFSTFLPHPPPPWFFIGCYDSAQSLQDKTCEMEEYIYPGNVINMQLLKHLFPGTKRWVYIHPQTFEETDFPSEGIVIEDEHAGNGR